MTDFVIPPPETISAGEFIEYKGVTFFIVHEQETGRGPGWWVEHIGRPRLGNDGCGYAQSLRGIRRIQSRALKFILQHLAPVPEGAD